MTHPHESPSITQETASSDSTSEKHRNSATPAEKPLGTLGGDRLCATCTYNLIGQSITREPHYGMLIVRCPECATPAPLTEYPRFSTWANRWRLLLAGLWLLVMLGLLALTVTALSVALYIISEEAAHPAARYLAEHQLQWAQNEGVYDPNQTWRYNVGGWTSVDSNWRNATDVRQLLAEFESPAFFFEPQVWSIFIIIGMWLFGFGVIWSVVMPHLRRRWLPIAGLMLVGIALGVTKFIQMMEVNTGFISMTTLVIEIQGFRYYLMISAVLAVFLISSMVAGRSIARLAVRGLLPPRLCSTFAPLWTVDGLAPPRPFPRPRAARR